MAIQHVNVTWEMSGFIDVEADSMAEAMEKIKENPDDYDLPDYQEYVDSSFRLSADDPADMELLKDSAAW